MNKFLCDSCQKKLPKSAVTPASKREVSRAMKESANLWEALTDTETKLNAIVGHLMSYTKGGASREIELVKLSIDMTIQQAEELQVIRERLLSYDNGPMFPATDECA